MRIEEITDDVAERLKVTNTKESQAESGPTKENPTSQSQPQPTDKNAGNGASPSPEKDAASQAMMPELSPGRAMESRKTVDEVVADLKKSPLFMTELEENDETEALKALAYEGAPSEVASDFRDRGNECFKARATAAKGASAPAGATRLLSDAKEFYTKGIQVLAAEERKRRNGEPTAPEKRTVGMDGDDEDLISDEEAAVRQRALLEALYVNRAACNLELRNYRSCWLDGAAALRINDRNVKAYYRSARALAAVGRLDEAAEACTLGLAVDPDNGALKQTAREVATKSEEAARRRREDEERAARDARREALLRAALKARGIRTRASERPPDTGDARVALRPDPDDPRSELAFPAVLLYPAHLESDFVKAFGETESIGDHLAYIFPLPWDTAGEYRPEAVECYMETAAGGLVKMGKRVPLLKMLASGKVEVVDEVVRLYVLPKARAEAWVKEFKEKKALERGGG